MAKARRRPEGDPNSVASSNPVETVDVAHGGAYSPDRIAERAYELYLARGGSDGQDFDDWLAAERELASGPSQSDHDE